MTARQNPPSPPSRPFPFIDVLKQIRNFTHCSAYPLSHVLRFISPPLPSDNVQVMASHLQAVCAPSTPEFCPRR